MKPTPPSSPIAQHARWLAFSAAVLLAGWSRAWAADPLPAIPPNVAVKAAAPMIMLNMSRDHQLFYRAYNEFTDLDGDGEPETGYKHSIVYGGYFDGGKCYTYDTTNLRFNPSRVVSDRYCGNTDEWSGNFLNWATMTRMDLVRKVLYGGYRSTDTASLTVLERAHLVTDAHSFAKYVSLPATDMRKLTPFSESEITLCSTSKPSDNNGTNAWSQTQTNPPLLRVVRGNYSLWGANERNQCNWNEEDAASDHGNNNNALVTGYAAAANNPVRATVGLGSLNYNVRVKVCDSSLLGDERCQAYGSSFKPIGLLHEYGETDQAEFGLITGSYANNIQGGVLRRNITSFKNEVDSTNGTFKSTVYGIVYNLNRLRLYGFRQSDGTYHASSANGGTSFCDYQTIGLTNGLCQSWGNPMGEMFMEAARYFGGLSKTSRFDYTDSGSPDADLGLKKEAWVDPYLRDSNANKEAAETKYGKGQCRKANVVNFNASVTSYDGETDDLAGFSNLPDAPGGTDPVGGMVNVIGAAEGIHGYGWSVGNTTTDGTTNACDVKTVDHLGDVRGLCPDGPGYKGSYSLAGLSYWTHVNPVRKDYGSFGTSAAAAPDAFKLNTFSVALSPAKPRIDITTTSGKKVSISPAYRLVKSATQIGSGTLVDFRVVEQTATQGRYLINWEDSEQGGDYDMDTLGLLTWTLNGDQLDVRTQIIGAATGSGQGFGYSIAGVQTRNGAKKADGLHFHSGIYGFNYADPVPIEVTNVDGTAHPKINASGGCNNCSPNTVGNWTIESGDVDAPSVAHYTANSTNAMLPVIPEPLWYAAKWGGFTDSNKDGKPNTKDEWDAEINATGLKGSDGVPDNYFVVYRPDELERALRNAFQKIVDASNNAPAVSSSYLVSGSLKYVASFSPDDGHGSLAAYQLGKDGFDTTPLWQADKLLTTATTRQIITSKPVSGLQTGTALTWTSLTTTQKSDLKGADTNTVGQARLAWLRGSRTGEGATLKKRNADSILGAVVNASPWIQGVPEATYRGPKFTDEAKTTYQSFRNGRLARRAVLWTAADDGMVHAFDAKLGTPLMSYLPAPLFPRLRGTTLVGATNVTAMADGQPYAADVIAPYGGKNQWRSYLFGSLGRALPGIYALDVTDTADADLSEAKAASLFKWQFDGTSTGGDTDLGYILADISAHRVSNQPVNVAQMNNGEFALIVGNGAKSANGVAALFIILTKGPDSSGSWSGRYKKIVVDDAGGNGLMQPNWVDLNGDGRPDAIYAGDLKGNLWKFDVSSSDWANWGVAFPKTETPKLPLYTALDTDASNTPLPITTMPQLRFHPKGGVMVVFGTGISMVAGDFPNNSRTQRAYGIWDSPDYGTSTDDLTGTGKKALPRGYGELVSRTLTRNGTTAYLTGGTIDWATKKGWVMNWPTTGEAVIANPIALTDLVGFTTIAPGVSSCEDGPQSFLTFVDPIGGLLTDNVLGTAKVTLDGKEVTVNVASVSLMDQKITVARDARRTTELTGDALVQYDTAHAADRKYLGVGKRGTTSLTRNVKVERIGWREIPTLTTH